MQDLIQINVYRNPGPNNHTYDHILSSKYIYGRQHSHGVFLYLLSALSRSMLFANAVIIEAKT
jgi:hypothetical protein